MKLTLLVLALLLFGSTVQAQSLRAYRSHKVERIVCVVTSPYDYGIAMLKCGKRGHETHVIASSPNQVGSSHWPYEWGSEPIFGQEYPALLLVGVNPPKGCMRLCSQTIGGTIVPVRGRTRNRHLDESVNPANSQSRKLRRMMGSRN